MGSENITIRIASHHLWSLLDEYFPSLAFFLGEIMYKTFNRFEWNKTICRTIKDLKANFPKSHLIGKRIKALNAVGSIEKSDSWNLRAWKIRENNQLIEKKSESENVDCVFYGNEPFVIVFEDNSTFEIQLLWGHDYCFSENQISPKTKDGINHCELNASILFSEIVGSIIKSIQVSREILIKTNSGFSLKISFRDSNHTFYALCKNGEVVQKKAADCFKALTNFEQIEIQDRHNTSSYFWIEPATELDSCAKGEFGVDYASDARISIEESYVYDYLACFLKKHYKPENHKVCRGENNQYFEWNLDPNLYKYHDMEEIISEIKETCHILKSDFNDKRLDEWKKYSIGANFINKEKRLERTKFIERHIEMIIDFYKRFCFQIEQMMKHYPNYECIDFMGP